MRAWCSSMEIRLEGAKRGREETSLRRTDSRVGASESPSRQKCFGRATELEDMAGTEAMRSRYTDIRGGGAERFIADPLLLLLQPLAHRVPP